MYFPPKTIWVKSLSTPASHLFKETLVSPHRYLGEGEIEIQQQKQNRLKRREMLHPLGKEWRALGGRPFVCGCSCVCTTCNRQILCECIWKLRSMLVSFFSCIPPYFLRQSLALNWELVNSARLMGQWVTRPLICTPNLQHWCYELHPASLSPKCTQEGCISK